MVSRYNGLILSIMLFRHWRGLDGTWQHMGRDEEVLGSHYACLDGMLEVIEIASLFRCRYAYLETLCCQI